MDTRKYQRKRSFRRPLVTLLALVMLLSVCFPALVVSAGEVAPSESCTVPVGGQCAYSPELPEGAADVKVAVPEGSGLEVSFAEGKFTVKAAAAQAGSYTVSYTYADAEAKVHTGSFVVKVTEPIIVVSEATAQAEAMVADPVEEAPAESTEAPAEPALLNEPAETTEAPVETTEAPAETTEAPAETTAVPVETTEAPVETTAAPAETTEVPVETTAVPAETTEAPVEPTEAPVETTAEIADADTPVIEVENSSAFVPAANATSGTFDHIEIEIAGSASIVIDGQTYTAKVDITTQDNFTVTATQGGNSFTNFSYTGNKTGNGSTTSETVELSGRYPTGTMNVPVIYTVSVEKTVSFDTDGDGVTDLDVPMTLTVTTNYWDVNNRCPGIERSKASWSQGNFIGGSGIDIDVSGQTVGTAITSGKIAIRKDVIGESDSSPFTFTIQDSTGKYLQFTDGAYTSLSDTAFYITVTAGQTVTLTGVPEGIYKITEIQKDGYIITDADGNSTSNYSYDYKVETKNDEEIPVVTFTNKKLTTEAGLSIAKVASGSIGENSYPNPTVSIYKYENDEATGTPVWTGTLIANGDRLYLTTTLPAGTYIVVEEGASISGYACGTTLTGNASINGMVFTVEAGSRYDLTVNNTYVSADSDQADQTYITVSKTFEGLTAEQIDALKTDFTITLTKDGTVVATLKLTDANVKVEGMTYTWIVYGLETGTYTVSESGTNVDDFELSDSGTGDVTITAATISADSITIVNSCNKTQYNIGSVDFIAAKLTENAGYFVWTRNTLSASLRAGIIEFINTGINGMSGATAANTYFYSGDSLSDADGLLFRGYRINYDQTAGVLSFTMTSQWAKFAYGGYTITENKNGEVSIKNSYSPKTTSVSVSKTVTGSMGDIKKQFAFTYKVGLDGTEHKFNLAHGNSYSIENVQIGSDLYIKEDHGNYIVTVSYTTPGIDGADPVTTNVSPSDGWYIIPVGSTGISVSFVNDLDPIIDTGVLDTSYPFIVLLSTTLVAGFVLLLHKRRYLGEF